MIDPELDVNMFNLDLMYDVDLNENRKAKVLFYKYKCKRGYRWESTVDEG